VFTVGHRNPQGLAWLPDDTPVATEHGPNAKDEVNCWWW
jgi:glucose/arabinose dehydrogenase